MKDFIREVFWLLLTFIMIGALVLSLSKLDGAPVPPPRPKKTQPPETLSSKNIVGEWVCGWNRIRSVMEFHKDGTYIHYWLGIQHPGTYEFKDGKLWVSEYDAGIDGKKIPTKWMGWCASPCKSDGKWSCELKGDYGPISWWIKRR